jgi:fatty-acid peroxygenase
VAAVELLNVLRPTVAVARFVTFAALALHEHPRSKQKLRSDDYLEHFVQEVRRYYAFFPFIGGHVREPFDWRGHRFTEGTWVLLDLYGTDHDERVWENPEAFRPERFAKRGEPDAFDFIPQGGGDHFAGHRCAGEWVTIALMKAAVRLLTESMQYDVPAQQDLAVPLTRMPTLPKSGFAMRDVRRTPS